MESVSSLFKLLFATTNFLSRGLARFLEGDFWVFVADLTAGDFEGFRPGLARLGFEFSQTLGISVVFDRLVCGFFVGVDDPAAFLALGSIGESLRKARPVSPRSETVEQIQSWLQGESVWGFFLICNLLGLKGDKKERWALDAL